MKKKREAGYFFFFFFFLSANRERGIQETECEVYRRKAVNPRKNCVLRTEQPRWNCTPSQSTPLGSPPNKEMVQEDISFGAVDLLEINSLYEHNNGFEKGFTTGTQKKTYVPQIP